VLLFFYQKKYKSNKIEVDDDNGDDLEAVQIENEIRI
jgi:hypothetical protein